MSTILATVVRRRGRHRWTSPLRHGAVSMAIVAGVPLVLFASCGNSSSPATPPPSTSTTSTSTRPSPTLVRPLPGVPVGHVVVYQATGPQHVTVVYPSLGTVATQAGAASPWSHQATVTDDDLGLVSLAVGNPDDLDGAITCTILVDGRVAAHQAAAGAYSSVLCSLATGAAS